MSKMKIIVLITLLILTFSKLYAEVTDINSKISIDLRNVELATALNMIATQNDLNLILSTDVQGEISIRLTDVDIKTALDAILLPNDLTYIYQDNIIIVKSINSKSIKEYVTEVVKLNYANPNPVKAALDAVKSQEGNIVILDNDISQEGSTTDNKYSPNKIFISDLPYVVDRMKTIIQAMDNPERTISITVKIIETTIDSLSKLGLNWPATITSNIGGSSISNGSDNLVTGSTESNALLRHDFNNGDWSWGNLTVNQLSTVLDILEQDGNSKLVSYPNITTLENHEAEIRSETIIPIPTISRFTEAAATQDIMTFYDEEVGISLRVTPRINENGKITMNVNAKIEDIIGYTGSADAQKPITISRSISNRTTVSDGETAALGGLIKEDVIESRQRIPVLGSIPLLGKLLFSSSSEEKRTTDLIILITPTIIK
ncbi:type II secretion system protein GspD [Candidatus Zixiibacteriota bacterium]